MFAAHPVHAEAVAWITARADLLAALGCLTSFYGIVRYRAWNGPAWLALAWCAYVAGIFSKEFCLVLPLLVLTFDLLFPRRRPNATWWRLLLPYLGFALLMALYFWCRSQALGAQVGANAIPWLTKDFWRQVAQREFIYFGELFWPVASWLPRRRGADRT